MMSPETARPSELGHPGASTGCCGHAAAETETPYGNPAGETLTERPDLQEGGRWSALKSFTRWFLAFFGIYASSSVCPFCGRMGCPVGVVGSALVGGVFACLWQYGRGAWEKFKGFVAKG